MRDPDVTSTWRTGWERFVHRLPTLSGVALVLLGSVVLVGWGISSTALVQVFERLAPVQGNTALCFVLSGLALLGVGRRPELLVSILGLVIAGVAGVVFSQYAFDVDFGVDQLLFEHSLPTHQSRNPGRMAPNTAVAFILAGLGLAGIGRHRFASIVALLGSVVFTLGTAVILGFLVGVEAALSWGDLTQMALPTAVGLILLGASIVALAMEIQPADDRSTAGARRAALLAGATAALLALLFWHALRVEREARLRWSVQQTALSASRELAGRILVMAKAMENLAERGARSGWVSRDDWRQDAWLSVGAFPDFERIEWVDRDFEVRLILAVAPESGSPPVDSRTEDLWSVSLDHVRRSGKTSVSGPFLLPDGGSGFRIFVPIRAAAESPAYLSGLVSVRRAFSTLIENLAPGYDVSIACNDQPVVPVVNRAVTTLIGSAELNLPGPEVWRLEVTPQPAFLRRERSALPELALFGGIAIAVLLGATIWFGVMATRRALRFQQAVDHRTRELERVLQSLRSENEERRRSEQTLERTQRVSRLVSGELDLQALVQAVTDAARELTGAAYAAFFYNLTDAQGEAYTLYSLSGIERQVFEGYPMPRNTELFAPTFGGEGVVRCDDVRDHPRYGKNPPHRGLPADHPMSIVSYLAVPVRSRSGDVWGGLLFGHPEPGVFSEREEAIAVSLAAQAAIAMDNASLLEAERRARDEAQSASAAKDRFLSIVSHELRNPLGSIRSALEVLDRDPDDPGSEGRMREILKRQVKQLEHLVDDLLDVSRVVTGKIALRVRRIDLVQLVHQVFESARTRIEAGGRRLTHDLPETPVWVDGDPARLTQALDNLLANAAKFTDPGESIRLEVRRPIEESATNAVEVAVIDTGRGIPEERLADVFLPFYQSLRDADRESVSGGLGLGLAIFKGIVEAHEGKVAARSAGPGSGTELSFTIPVKPPPEPVAAADAAEADESRGQRVLVIDDHQDSLDGLSELLRVLGHDVITASDGKTGIELARERPLDVVICDIGMPGTDGYTVAVTLRGDDRTADLRLIALTGYGDEASVRKAYGSGFDLHMTKPVDPSLLRRVLSGATTDGPA